MPVLFLVLEETLYEVNDPLTLSLQAATVSAFFTLSLSYLFVIQSVTNNVKDKLHSDT